MNFFFENFLFLPYFFVYFWISIIILQILALIITRHPMYTLVYFLMLILFSSVSLLFIYYPFITFLIIYIYVGALAVFFLFIIMTVNFKQITDLMSEASILKTDRQFSYFFGFIFIVLWILIQMLELNQLSSNNIIIMFYSETLTYFNFLNDYDFWSENKRLSQLWFVNYSFLLILVGFFLFIVSIGIITITKKPYRHEQSQYYVRQLGRRALLPYYNITL